MNTPKEQYIDDSFGVIKKVEFDPSGERVVSLGEDAHHINFYISETLTPLTAKNLNVFENLTVSSFLFLNLSSTFLVGIENKLVSFDWPTCSSKKELYEHENQIEYISATTSEELIAIADNHNVILLRNYHNRCELIQNVFNSNNEIMWIGFGPLCNTLVIFTSDYSSNKKSLISINSEDYTTIMQQDIYQSGANCLPCFTRQSDLLVLNNGDIRAISHLHENEAIFQNENHNPDIVAIATSSTSNHIATCDIKGNIVISNIDRSKYNYSKNPESPQKIAFISTFKYKGCTNNQMATISWGYGSLSAGDTDGTIHLWGNIIEEAKPLKSTPASKQPDDVTTKTLKKRSSGIIEALMSAPVIPKKTKNDVTSINEDDSLTDLGEDDNNKVQKVVKQPIKKAQKKKPKAKKTKPTQNNKISSKNYLAGEKISDDENDDEEQMAEFIEPAEVFEERLKEIVPEKENVEPEIDFFESETSSDHEIEIEEYLTPEQKEKLFPKNPENIDNFEALQKVGLIQSENELSTSSGVDDDDMLEFEDLENDITYAFMPGNNDHFVGNRRYMCWNDYAAVLLRLEEDGTTEIDIHKTDGTDPKAINNLNNFTMATIDENGFVGASSSIVIYTHHKSWAPDPITTVHFENESAKLIACGADWFAVATDTPSIRTFTSAGLELSIIPIPQSCRVMVGRGKYLFFAFGKDLDFCVIDVLKNKTVINGVVNVAQPVKWAGFDNENRLYIQDRLNIIHALCKDFSWQWIPVLSLEDYFDTVTDNFWVVKAKNGNIFGIPLRSTRSPPTNPIPKLHSLDCHILTFDPEVRPWLMKKVLYCFQKAKVDAELLKMFPDAVKTDQEYRAYHIAQNINSKKARQFIVPYADNLGAVVVADKLTGTNRIPQRKVSTIYRKNNSDQKKNKRKPIRSSSEDQVVYVRKASDAPKTTKADAHDDDDNEDSLDGEESTHTADSKTKTTEHPTENNDEKEMNSSSGPSSLFEVLKKLGAAPTTSLFPSKGDNNVEVKKKATQKKKQMAPIRTKTRKPKKAPDTSTFKPLFD